MRKEDLIKEIKTSESDEKIVKVLFKAYGMQPVVGVFVKCFDSEELSKKGFFRFATTSNFEQYKESNKTHFTKLFSVDQLQYIYQC